jgi:hypothetical protein
MQLKKNWATISGLKINFFHYKQNFASWKSKLEN